MDCLKCALIDICVHFIATLLQAVMFMAGANSIFTGDKLLTTPNAAMDEDSQMFEQLGLKGKIPFTGTNATLPQFSQGLEPNLNSASSQASA